jgi:predicted anti-sigma-YlaC factor YlaD
MNSCNWAPRLLCVVLEHLSGEQIDRYRSRAMPPGELLIADGHLATCDLCRGQLGTLPEIQTLVHSLKEDLDVAAEAEQEHLLYDQLAAYVDEHGDAAEREVVESHLAWCADCSAEVRDLRALRTIVSSDIAEEFAPSTPEPRRRSLADFWTSPARWVCLYLAAATAVAAIVIALVTNPLRAEVTQMRSEISRLEQTNQSLQKRLQTRVTNMDERRGSPTNPSP